MQSDASGIGLGAILIQNNQQVAYASCTLTAAEQQYSQIEKEPLSILFVLEKFHVYMYGRPVLVENNRKLLEMITKKPLHQAPQ